MKHVEDEVGDKFAKPAPAPRRHDKSTSGTKFWRYVGILGTNKQIRQEALSVLERNVQGTFDIMIALDFRLLPGYILGLIDQTVTQQQVMDSARFRYFLQFSNLKRAAMGIYIVNQWKSGHDCHNHLRDMPQAERATYLAEIEVYYNSQDALKGNWEGNGLLLHPHACRYPLKDVKFALSENWAKIKETMAVSIE